MQEAYNIIVMLTEPITAIRQEIPIQSTQYLRKMTKDARVIVPLILGINANIF